MDLCADQLLAHLPEAVAATDVAPPFRRAFGLLPFARRAGFNADRLLNRHLLLPRAVRRAARRADFVHVVDHSYAHLLHSAPQGRAGVYCHDLDAFRCLLEPAKEPRSRWFRWLARRALNGLKRAAVVFHSTAAVGERLRSLGLINPGRLVHAPYGVAPEFAPDGPDAELPLAPEPPYLLHVGSNIARKRLDVLLTVFAEYRRLGGHLRLVQVGGPWPPELAAHIARLGVAPLVTQVRDLTRSQLATLYRRAAAVLVTSEAEGFGLPVIEALACGTPVVASGLPTLREAGGGAAEYCPVGDVPAWLRGVRGALLDRDRGKRLAQAARFSWRAHARIIAEAYLGLPSGGRKPPVSRQ